MVLRRDLRCELLSRRSASRDEIGGCVAAVVPLFASGSRFLNLLRSRRLDATLLLVEASEAAPGREPDL
jgi:hypothetical protein